jgi:hypothetical protein
LPSRSLLLCRALGLAVALVFGGILALTSGATRAAAQDEDGGVDGVTTKDETPVLSAPRRAAPVIETLPRGTALRLQERDGQYWRVLRGSQLGYVPADSVKLTPVATRPLPPRRTLEEMGYPPEEPWLLFDSIGPTYGSISGAGVELSLVYAKTPTRALVARGEQRAYRPKVGVGIAAGFGLRDESRYAEVEGVWWLRALSFGAGTYLTVGAGPRVAGGSARGAQGTLALSASGLVLYARAVSQPHEATRPEAGLMLKYSILGHVRHPRVVGVRGH